MTNGNEFTVLAKCGNVLLRCRTEYLPGKEHASKDRRGVFCGLYYEFEGRPHCVWLGYMMPEDVASHAEIVKLYAENLTITDERGRGWFCGDCRTFADKPQMVFSKCDIIHKSGSLLGEGFERMAVKYHYDGCRGWN